MHNLGGEESQKKKGFYKPGLAMSHTKGNTKLNKVLFQARLCKDKKHSRQVALGAAKMCPLLWDYSLYYNCSLRVAKKIAIKDGFVGQHAQTNHDLHF